MKRFVSFLLLLLLVIKPITVLADIPAAPIIDSESVIMVNGRTGEKIYAKKSENKINTDSLIPLIASIIALENKSPDEYIIVEDLNPEINGVISSNTMKLYTGEKFLVKDLLALILLSGDENALNSLAISISGTPEAFASLCNRKAMDLKMNNTKITGISLATSVNDFTTVADMAVVMKEFSKNPVLMNILGTKTLNFNPSNIAPEVRTLDNENLQIYSQSEDFYEKSKGGIIAETKNSKNNSYVSVAEDGEQRFIIALAQSKKLNDSYKNSKALFEWGFNNFVTKKIILKGTTLQEWPLKNGEILDLVAGEDFYQTVKKTNIGVLDAQHSINYKPLETTADSFYKGQIMGVAEIIVNENTIGEVPLLSSKDVVITPKDPLNEPTELDFIRMWMIRIGLAVLFLFLLILIIRTYNKIKRSKVKQARIKKRRKEYLEVKRSAREKENSSLSN